jgi:hypothetical protein
MRGRCTVQRPMTVSGQGGSPNTQWPDVTGLVDLPCWPLASLLGARITADTTLGQPQWRVRLAGDALLPGAPAIKTGDRLRITGHQIPGVPDPLVLYAAGESGLTGVEVSRLVVATATRPGGL